MSNTYYFGVDGGNSKTEVALIDAGGNLLAQMIGAPLRLSARATPRMIGLLKDLIDTVLRQAGVKWEQVAHFGFGLAGADYEDEMPAQYRALLRGMNLTSDRLTLVNDGVAALWGGSNKAGAVILQLGTAYTSAYRDEFGRETPFDHLNAGVQFEIRMYTLTTAARMFDGRVKRTVLADLVLEHFGFDDPMDLAKRFTRRTIDRWKLLSVIDVLKKGVELQDPASIRIVGKAADYYAKEVDFLIKKVGKQNVDVALGGGLLLNGPSLLPKLIRQKIKAKYPRVTVHQPWLTPAIGAAVMASYYAGAPHQKIYRETRKNLKA